jgi:hypothetical protein
MKRKICNMSEDDVGGRAPSMPGTRVYVGNLSWDAQWQDLKDHMRGPNQDLNVLHADIMTESTGLLHLYAMPCPILYFRKLFWR